MALASLLGYVSRRHALPPLVLLLGIVAVGVPIVGGYVLAALRRIGLAAPARPAVATALGLAMILGVALPKDLKARRVEREALRRAAEWVRAETATARPVAAHRLRVAYYAGAAFVDLPEPGGRLLPHLRSRGVRYVIVDETEAQAYPELREPARFAIRVVHRSEAGDRRAAVFDIEGPGPPGTSGETAAD